MEIAKINDGELAQQQRWHVNQQDVPGMEACDMKAFFDYIPREVIIPKLNETVDAVNSVYTAEQTDQLLAEKADSTEVYTKDETDSLVQQKADKTSTYLKSETYNKEEVYSKAETDGRIQNSAYTKSQTDTKLSLKLNTSSDRIILDTEDISASDFGRVYRSNGELYLRDTVFTAPEDGGIYTIASLGCRLSSEAELRAYLATQNVTAYTPLEILLTGSHTQSYGYGYLLRFVYDDDYFVEECLHEYSDIQPLCRHDLSWLWDEYTMNTIYENISNGGYSADGMLHFTACGRYIFVLPVTVTSPIATKAYVDAAIKSALNI